MFEEGDFNRVNKLSLTFYQRKNVFDLCFPVSGGHPQTARYSISNQLQTIICTPPKGGWPGGFLEVETGNLNAYGFEVICSPKVSQLHLESSVYFEDPG